MTKAEDSQYPRNVANWRALYPYESHFETIGGFRMHYLDEGPKDGSKPTLLCSHGNPTWSFFFRSVINEFRDQYRVVVVDHIGCGLSEKPSLKKYPYSLGRRGQDLIELIEKLDLKNIALIAHDWGGAVAMCAATQIPDRFSKIILMNTAAYLSDRVPKRIRLCHIPVLKRIMLQGLNVFPRAATRMATAKGLAPDVKAGLLAPYDSWANRIAVCEFVQDIPLSPRHRSYEALKGTGERLNVFKDEQVALIWGVKDWCFPPEVFLDEFLKYYPNAYVKKIEDAGHYLLEDSPKETLGSIREFLER
ncbi:MAG: alpha/beta fold hydrolase [Planctomycetia bacterium]|nr:alpha/beta fold hydrolase [Planctomycetia bacterium]